MRHPPARTFKRPDRAYGPFRCIFNALLGLALGFVVLAGTAEAQTAGSDKGREHRLLVLGDSLTAGYGLDSQEGFAAQLEKALRAKGHHITVINGGVSGDTSAGGRARLDWSLADKPTAAIVELGANDGLRGLEPSQTYDNLAAILTTLRDRNIPVLIAGMLAPPNLGAAYGGEFREVYTRLAKDFDAPLYPFFLDGVAAESALNQSDGMHPNAKGVAVIVERILPAVEKLLATAPRSAG